MIPPGRARTGEGTEPKVYSERREIGESSMWLWSVTVDVVRIFDARRGFRTRREPYAVLVLVRCGEGGTGDVPRTT